VVITGGPGAGKTALLEMVRRDFCEHVAVLPEAASIVYGGGFPRGGSEAARRAGQRAIFRVQQQLERMAIDERRALALCDRGTLDGLAYWPGSERDWYAEMGIARDAELSRYAAVIHLRTPAPERYNHRNPLRTESAAEAAALDARILAAWSGHPRLCVVEQTSDFVDKVGRALVLLRGEIPECCRRHELRAWPMK
jgi:predicted ATPase